MIRVAVSVEGRTEEEFIKSVLADHLLQRSALALQPILIGNARHSGAGGGNVTVRRLATDMACLYENFDAVTSLVDFYGFKGAKNTTLYELQERVFEEIGKKIGNEPDPDRIFPYIQRYELEGLLFSKVESFARIGLPVSEEAIAELQAVRADFPTPEDINDNPHTIPSRRIAKAIPDYMKTLHGPLVGKDIGLAAIRDTCPCFDAWVTRLEALGKPT